MFCSSKDFEFELARRTIANLNNIDHQYVQQKEAGKADYQISDVYEVTQLLNSFIGLLVIPRERFLTFGNIRMPSRFETEEARELLDKLNRERNKPSGRFHTTYYNGKEQLNPWTISRHLRDAISHGSLDIHPQTVEQGSSITGFTFRDKNINKPEEEFELELSIQEIRLILIETANLILSHFPQKYEPLKLDYLVLPT